ncbi:ANKRD50 [Symbiodinium natans]|uniref:ANKRD50 protein n=1 Tax=Symbiodinium natans TaxID=878477 RepID=A0A812P6A4_9DINO|nr:ANKRD50 [Symbiodinium natans]
MLRVYLASGELLEVDTQEVAKTSETWPPSVLSLKRHLQQLCGQPRFKLRLLCSGTILEDSEVLASSLDLQLVVLPFCLSREAQCRELMQAIFVNSTEEVEAILQRPQDPNLKPDSQDAQDAALHLALQLRRSDIVQLLLEAWADVDKPDGRGSSPVFKAVDIHHLEALRALLAARADADKANSMGQTPLLQAAANGLTEAASLLVQAGADKELNVNGRTPLHTAVQGGHSGVVRVLLEARSDLNSVDRHGCTPLRMAAEVGDLVAMRLLLDAKADVDKGDFNSLSPLLVVLGNLEGQGGRLEGHGRLRLVRVLMEASADVNKADATGRTPVLVACLRGCVEITKLLVEAGATLHKAWVKEPSGDTVGSAHPEIVHLLSEAAANGSVETARLLVEAGADKDELNSYGKTPLYMAALCGHPDVTKLLLEAQADPNKVADDGSTPLRMAAELGDLETTQRLLEAGADTDRADNAGLTPLLAACIHGKVEVARALVAAGADAKAIEANSDNEVQHLESVGNLEGVRMLMEAEAGEARASKRRK